MFWIAFRGLPDHLKIVSVLAVARWFLGTAFAVYLFMKVADLPVGTEVDAAILLTVAWASFCLAQLRLVQALARVSLGRGPEGSVLRSLCSIAPTWCSSRCPRRSASSESLPTAILTQATTSHGASVYFGRN